MSLLKKITLSADYNVQTNATYNSVSDCHHSKRSSYLCKKTKKATSSDLIDILGNRRRAPSREKTPSEGMPITAAYSQTKP